MYCFNYNPYKRHKMQVHKINSMDGRIEVTKDGVANAIIEIIDKLDDDFKRERLPSERFNELLAYKYAATSVHDLGEEDIVELMDDIQEMFKEQLTEAYSVSFIFECE